jgi:hypothetical protein
MVERYKPAPQPISQKGFKKGVKRPIGAGRALGTTNKIPKLIKEAICGAAEELGMLEPIYRYINKQVPVGNGKRKQLMRVRTDEIIGWAPTGKGGTQGYMVWLGCNYPKAFASLMGRTLPLQINANVNNKNVSVPERFSSVNLERMSLTEKMATMREMIGMTAALPAPGPVEQGLPTPDPGPIVEGEFEEITPPPFPGYKEAV